MPALERLRKEDQPGQHRDTVPKIPKQEKQKHKSHNIPQMLPAFLNCWIFFFFGFYKILKLVPSAMKNPFITSLSSSEK
jgi:hypothetical protein